jgi:exodeoxyribonuclease VII small subunit
MAEGQVSAPTVASFETCLEELEKVVRELESGDLALERSLELFSRGVQLSETCRKQLEEAETRVETLIRKEGTYQAEPFRPEK